MTFSKARWPLLSPWKDGKLERMVQNTFIHSGPLPPTPVAGAKVFRRSSSMPPRRSRSCSMDSNAIEQSSASARRLCVASQRSKGPTTFSSPNPFGPPSPGMPMIHSEVANGETLQFRSSCYELHDMGTPPTDTSALYHQPLPANTTLRWDSWPLVASPLVLCLADHL